MTLTPAVACLVTWMFELRTWVQWSGERVVVRNGLRRFELGRDKIEYVDGAIHFFPRRAPHLVLRTGRTIPIVALSPFFAVPGSESTRAREIASDLCLPYGRG